MGDRFSRSIGGYCFTSRELCDNGIAGNTSQRNLNRSFAINLDCNRLSIGQVNLVLRTAFLFICGYRMFVGFIFLNECNKAIVESSIQNIGINHILFDLGIAGVPGVQVSTETVNFHVSGCNCIAGGSSAVGGHYGNAIECVHIDKFDIVDLFVGQANAIHQFIDSGDRINGVLNRCEFLFSEQGHGCHGVGGTVVDVSAADGNFIQCIGIIVCHEVDHGNLIDGLVGFVFEGGVHQITLDVGLAVIVVYLIDTDHQGTGIRTGGADQVKAIAAEGEGQIVGEGIIFRNVCVVGSVACIGFASVCGIVAVFSNICAGLDSVCCIIEGA